MLREFSWRSAFKAGLIGSVVVYHVSLVGMVEAFSRREVIEGVVSMGQLLLFLAVMFTGYLTVRRIVPSVVNYFLGGALAGGVMGLALALLAVAIKPLHLRAVLANASPALVEIITFGKGPLVGGLMLIGVMAFLGGLAGLVNLVPSEWRRIVTNTVLIVLLVGVIRDVVAVLLPQSLSEFVFSASGLTKVGAVVLLVVIGGILILWSKYLSNLRQKVQSLPSQQQRAVRYGSFVLAFALLFLLPTIIGEHGSYVFEVIDMVGIYVIMGLGINIVVGFAGLLDLGYVAFFAIGAYTMAVLTTKESFLLNKLLPNVLPLNFWQALPFALLASLLSGIILGIPVLKTRGDYLAIITLGFGEIIRLLVLSDFLKPLLGGAQGITRIARPQLGSFVAVRPQDYYYFIVIAIVIGLFISARLKVSRLGRAWMAIREDEDVARAMGIDHVATKLTAFATGALLAGLSGAIFAAKINSMAPHSFNLLISINVLCLLIVGGMGSLPGVVVGALALVGLPELLREFAEYRLLVYGAALVAMMIFRPEGLWPETIRARELAEEEVLVPGAVAVPASSSNPGEASE